MLSLTEHALVASSTPHHAPVDHTKPLLAILRTTLKALTLTQNDLLDVVDRLSAFANDPNAIDIDIHKLGACVNFVSKMLVGLEGNVETTRILLGAGVAGDDDGLTMGDEMEVFWVEGDEMDGEEDGNDEVVEEEIDVEASDALLERWLEGCAWPEESYDV